MEKYLPIILIVCALLVPIHYKTKRFDRFWGILMFILGFGALFLRLIILKNYPLLGFFNRETICSSALLIFIPAIIFIFFGIFSKHFRKRIKDLKKLLLPYILFGGLQQIFFFWIFCDSIYYLSKSLNLTFVLTVLFFTIFHFTGQFPIKKLWVLLGLFAIVDTWVYLIWGNMACGVCAGNKREFGDRY
ncbi:MAG: hypothetical protein NT162_02515 [Candidatus Woesebacteria bacterium]|nr:hypothetical protein [Candidatus Woesebacteria bacterium]